MATLFIIGVIAVVIAAASLLFDGVLELPDSEWLSFTGLCAGVAVFCFVGGTMQGFSAPQWLWITAGIISALAVTGGTSVLLYKLRKVGMAETTPLRAMIGTMGSVVVPIEPGAFGQINLVVGGETVQMNAVADETIAISASVRVIDYESPTCVRVENLR